jgi:hypothetical protein
MLAVGCNAQVLTACSGETTGVKWAAASSGPSQATQAEAEAESNVDKYIPPDLIKNSPGVAKVWISNNATGTTAEASYNVTSTAKAGTGRYTITIATDFSSADYAIVATLQLNWAGFVATPNDSDGNAATAGAFEIGTFTHNNSTDPAYANYEHSAAAFGDQS